MRTVQIVAAFAALLIVLATFLLWHDDSTADPATPSTTEVELLAPQAVTVPPLPSVTTTTTSTAAPVRRVDRQLAGPLEGVPDSTWDAIADCESGDWNADGNVIAGTARWNDRRGGYEGGVHWLHSTWIRAGGGRFAVNAYDATREQQIEIANDWLARTSWRQWPTCSRKVGVA